MTNRSWRIVILAIAGCMKSSFAQASPLLEMMGGFGDMGGQQARNVASGASAAYFNPALLTEVPTGLTIGAAVLGARIAVELDGRGDGSHDVPAGLQNAAHADGTRFDGYPIATETLQLGREESPSQSGTSARPRQGQGSGQQTLSYGALGIVGHFFEERLALGFFGLIPLAEFMTLNSHYVDEREQYTSNSLHPELYGDRLTSLAFGFGLAYRFHKQFSLGLGAAFSLRADAGSPAYVADAGQLDSLLLNVDVKVNAGISPHGGFEYRPFSRWRITGTVHAPQEILVRADVKFLLSTGVEQTTELELVFDWMPWQVGLGSAVDVVQRKDVVLTLAGSAVYGRWSQYVDRHGEQPVSEFGWYDTITGALGARLTAGAWKLAVDLQYKPSPVPAQAGRSNYVDSDRVGAIPSLEYTIPIGDTKLKLGAQLQGFWLLDRYASKLTTPTFEDGVNRTPALVTDELPDDAQIGGQPVEGAAGVQTNNPGWPGFSSRGWLASAGLYLSLTL